MARRWALITACVLLLTACGDDAGEPGAEEEEQQQETEPATIEVADSSLGDIVVDADGWSYTGSRCGHGG